MTVYVDIVIGFNFTLNFLILCCVERISGIGSRKFGRIASAFLGGLYSVFMFDNRFYYFYSLPAKLIVSLAMIMVCFPFKGNFLKLLLYFYITAFAFSGAAAFASNFSGVLKVKNGMFYWENSIWVILA